MGTREIVGDLLLKLKERLINGEINLETYERLKSKLLEDLSPEDHPTHTRKLDTGNIISGKYRIIKLIGKGGMGSVYLAEHTALGKRVAIKKISDTFSQDEEFIQRFAKEARSQAKLNHPNIVQVMDFDPRSLCIIMEFVDGVNLKHLLTQEKKLAEDRAIAITKGVLNGLSYAHEHDVIHRDIKPQNILLTRKEKPKITDFGIALILGTARQTHTGELIGTPKYMSPEQIKTPARVDNRSDIYSVGIILFQLLTGELPFALEDDSNPDMSIILKHINDPPRAACAVNPEVSKPLSKLIMKSLEKDPDGRYMSCQDFLAALNRYQAAKRAPTPAPEVSLIDQPGPFAAEEAKPTIDVDPRILAATVHVDRAEISQHLAAKDDGTTQDTPRPLEAQLPPEPAAPVKAPAPAVASATDTVPPIGKPAGLEALADQTLHELAREMAPRRSSRKTLWIWLAAVMVVLILAMSAYIFQPQLKSMLGISAEQQEPAPEPIAQDQDEQIQEVVAPPEDPDETEQESADDADQDQAVADLLAQVTELRQQGDINGALALIAKAKAIKDSPEVIRLKQELTAIAEEDRLWRQTTDSATEEAYSQYVDRYPDGRYKQQAEAWLAANRPIKPAEEAPAEPETAEALIEKARQAYNKSRFILALDYLVQAEKLAPGAEVDTLRGRVKAAQADDKLWRKSEQADTKAAYQEYLAAYAKGRHSAAARKRVQALEQAEKQAALQQHINQARAYLRQKAYDQALAEVELAQGLGNSQELSALKQQILDAQALAGQQQAEKPPEENQPLKKDIYAADEVDVPPVPRNTTKPKYPNLVRRSTAINGMVIAEIVIDTQGKVVNVTILRGIKGNYEELFNKEARRTLKQWRYKPAMHQGDKVKVKMVVTLKFISGFD